jgi:hypothetical protein
MDSIGARFRNKRTPVLDELEDQQNGLKLASSNLDISEIKARNPSMTSFDSEKYREIFNELSKNE